MRLEPMPLVVKIVIFSLLGVVVLTGVFEITMLLIKKERRRRYMQNLKVLISMYKNIVDTLGKDNDYSKIRYRKIVNRLIMMCRENMITDEVKHNILQEINKYGEQS